jgi:hypothetical protein
MGVSLLCSPGAAIKQQTKIAMTIRNASQLREKSFSAHAVKQQQTECHGEHLDPQEQEDDVLKCHLLGAGLD